MNLVRFRTPHGAHAQQSLNQSVRVRQSAARCGTRLAEAIATRYPPAPGDLDEAPRIPQINDRAHRRQRRIGSGRSGRRPKRKRATRPCCSITENGPNNLDIHGVGTNRPGYEASWNCYDRLITNDKKTLPDGSLSYDRDKFRPELAEDMNAGDMSVDLQAAQGRQVSGWHAGHRQGCEVVVRPRGHRRRIPDRADEGRLAAQAGTIRRCRRRNLPRRLHHQEPAHRSRSRGDRARESTIRNWSRSTPPTRIRGGSIIPRATPRAAAPTRSRAGSPA